MKTILNTAILFLAAVSLFIAHPCNAASRKESSDMHYADTLHTPSKQQQFLKAVELAPETFSYKQLIRNADGSITLKGMKFNDSMKTTLAHPLVTSDPGLYKRLRKLKRLTWPLNATCDLTVKYKWIQKDLAIDYYIKNISVFGIGKLSTSMFEDYD